MAQASSIPPSRARRIGESRGDRVFHGYVLCYLLLVLLAILYPLIYVFSNAFSAPSEVLQGHVWLWPVNPSLESFQVAFRDSDIMTSFFNSVFYTVVGTAVNVTLTVCLAYPLSRKSFVGRGVISFLVIFTLFFGGGLIPYYLVTQDLGLVNTRWSQIIPSAVAVWQVVIARTFFQHTIPEELAEAAEVDGCSDIMFILRVVLPLSKPILAVLALMYAVWHWNSYFDALIFLNDSSLQPLQIVLRNILILNSTANIKLVTDPHSLEIQQGLTQSLQFSVIVIGMLPMLALYPWVQRHFVKGVMIGSLKG